MMLRAVLRYEIGHLLRQPATWLSLSLLPAVTWIMVTEGGSPVGTGALVNAPAKVAMFTGFIGLLGTLLTAGLFVEAAHRDQRSRMEPLLYTSPLRKREYLGGRFAGALLVNALLLLVIPAGLALGTLLPRVTPEMLGPFHAGSYLAPYVVFLLPNLLVNAAVLFGVTALSRRALPGYLAALALTATYLVAVNATAGLERPGVAALVDPTGIVALMGAIEGWARAELDARPVPIAGLLLWNRLLWTAIGVGILAYTYRRFRLAHPEPRAGRARRANAPAAAPRRDAAPQRGVAVPDARRSFGLGARVRQTMVVARGGVRHVVSGREFLLVVVGLAVLGVFAGTERLKDPVLGAPLWPLTRDLATVLSGRVLYLVFALLTAFYAGELVWRERDAGMEKIGDSVPLPDWVPFVGKLVALALVLAMLQVVLVAAGMGLQLAMGHTAVEPWLYARMMFGMRFPDYLLFAMLALCLHVLVNQKYLGHLLAALAYVALTQTGRFGIEHKMLVYGSGPGWGYSDLIGFGPFVAAFVWFKLYWAGWALLLGVVALLFWVRGAEGGARWRLRLARRRFTRRAAVGAAAAGGVVLVAGGFTFYNTNVLHEYRTSWESQAVRAGYERRYRRFEHAPRPRLTGVRLHAEVYPERRAVTMRGTYRLVNRTAVPIDSIHLSTFAYPEVALRGVRFDRPARPVLEDAAYGYYVHALARPLAPGDSLLMSFDAAFAPRGFENNPSDAIATAVAGNGTYLQLMRVLPMVGYQRELLELGGDEARRAHGLPPRSFFRPIDDPEGRRIARSAPEADWIDLDATVGTAGDQTAVVPGTLRRSWVEGWRRYFHYRTDAPIMYSLSLWSARYAVRETRWAPDSGAPVVIRALHHPSHAFNVDSLLRWARASLEHHATRFGPYPYPTLTLIEVPSFAGNFGRAFPGGMMYTENNPIAVGRVEGNDEGDMALVVVAHEIAHQWWGHQLMGASVAGSQVLSETLAHYSALAVLERTHGADATNRFARSMHLGYVGGRGDGASPEVPLLLSGDQSYIHYRKGAVVMWTLRDYLGADSVDAALGRLLAAHALRGPPYPTARDLHAALRAVTADSLRPLLEDLLTTVTLWDLRAAGARAEPAGGGAYRVTLEVEAAKMRADSVGNDTPVPMDDLVEIGVFAAPRAGDGAGETLYLRKHRIRSGKQTITVTVPRPPARAGIDPYHRLVTRHLEGLLSAKVVAVEVAER